jgi:hypothetical protein
MASELLFPSVKEARNGRVRDWRNGAREFRGGFCDSEGRFGGAFPHHEDGPPPAPVANQFYFREPRSGFLSWVCRILFFFRFGLLIMKVPLPRYSALYNVSSAKTFSPVANRQI